MTSIECLRETLTTLGLSNGMFSSGKETTMKVATLIFSDVFAIKHEGIPATCPSNQFFGEKPETAMVPGFT